MLHRIKRRRLMPTVNEMMATHKNAVVIANIRLSKEYLARVNLQEKGLESAEIILQVYQINPSAMTNMVSLFMTVRIR